MIIIIKPFTVSYLGKLNIVGIVYQLTFVNVNRNAQGTMTKIKLHYVLTINMYKLKYTIMFLRNNSNCKRWTNPGNIAPLLGTTYSYRCSVFYFYLVLISSLWSCQQIHVATQKSQFNKTLLRRCTWFQLLLL